MASGSASLTVEIVHTLLGTATDERLLGLLEALAGSRLGRGAWHSRASAGEGVQPSELLGGLIDLIRDAMILAVGAESMLLAISPRNRHRLKDIVDRWTVDSIIAALEILAACRSRMRGSIHGRLLLETALVRVARLEELTKLSTLVEKLAALESGAPPRRPEAAGAKLRPSADGAPPAAPPPPRVRSTPDEAAPTTASPPTSPPPLTKGGPTSVDTATRAQAQDKAPPTTASPPTSLPPLTKGGPGGSSTSVDTPTRAQAQDKAPPTTASPPTSPPPLTKGGPGGSPTSVDSATPAIHAGPEPAEAKPDRPAAEPPVADLAPSVSGSTAPAVRRSPPWERPAQSTKLLVR